MSDAIETGSHWTIAIGMGHGYVVRVVSVVGDCITYLNVATNETKSLLEKDFRAKMVRCPSVIEPVDP